MLSETDKLVASLSRMREINMGIASSAPPEVNVTTKFNYVYADDLNVYYVSCKNTGIFFAVLSVKENFVELVPLSSVDLHSRETFELECRVGVTYNDIIGIEDVLCKKYDPINPPNANDWVSDVSRRANSLRQESSLGTESNKINPKLKLTVEFIAGTSNEHILASLIAGDDTIISDVVVESYMGKELPMVAKNMLRTGISELLVRTMKSFEIRVAEPQMEHYSSNRLNSRLAFKVIEKLEEVNGSDKELIDTLNHDFKTLYVTVHGVPWSRTEYLTFLDNYFNYHYGHWDAIASELTYPITIKLQDERIGYLVGTELDKSGKDESSLLSLINEKFNVRVECVRHVPWTSSEGYIDLLAEFFAVEREVWVQNFKFTE